MTRVTELPSRIQHSWSWGTMQVTVLMDYCPGYNNKLTAMKPFASPKNCNWQNLKIRQHTSYMKVVVETKLSKLRLIHWLVIICSFFYLLSCWYSSPLYMCVPVFLHFCLLYHITQDSYSLLYPNSCYNCCIIIM